MDNDVIVTGPDRPIHFSETHKTSDVLDIVITNELEMLTEVETAEEGSSDHNPLLITLDSGEKGYEEARPKTNKFRRIMRRRIRLNRVISIKEELESAVHDLPNDIKEALKKSEVTVIVKLYTIYGEIPEALKGIIRFKNKEKRRAREYPRAVNIKRSKELENTPSPYE